MERQLIEMLRDEMRTGFATVTAAIGQTNTRLDHTNQRLNQTVECLDLTNQRLDQTVERLDQTVERLDEALIRIDENTASIKALDASVTVRLDGIGKYLQSINGSVFRHEERLGRLERRMDKLEDAS